jgi:hypothetical protein
MPKSKVFLAWSGPRSRAVATALKEWLPRVIQNLEPWMSESDIDKGTVWHKELSAQLSNITTGIICLTPENLGEPWINFEAGALSKLEGSHALTYLLEVDAASVPFPLAGFNATRANKEDTKKLIETLNKKLGEAGLQQAQLATHLICGGENLKRVSLKPRTLHILKNYRNVNPKICSERF